MAPRSTWPARAVPIRRACSRRSTCAHALRSAGGGREALHLWARLPNEHIFRMSTFTEPAKKHLGQHFLHERGIVEKIVLAVDPQPGDRLVEIGPGQGAITFPLLKKHGSLT